MFRLTHVTPDDPQCNGYVENIVKMACKLLHTAASESKDTKSGLNNSLLHYCAIPHSMTGRSPAEMNFNGKLQTKLHQVFIVEKCNELRETRERRDEKRLQWKKCFNMHKKQNQRI